MAIPLHSLDMLDGCVRAPADSARLRVGVQLAIPFPPSTNSLTALGAITAGTGFTSLPTIALTAGTGAGGAVVATSLKAISATVVSGGASGFAVGDLITLSNGVVLVVATVGSGIVLTVTISPTRASPITVGITTTLSQVSTSGVGVGITTWTVVYGLGSAVITNSGTYTVVPTGMTVTGGGGSGASLAAPTLGGTTGAVYFPVTFLEPLPPLYQVTVTADGASVGFAVNQTLSGFTAGLTVPGVALNGGLANVTVIG